MKKRVNILLISSLASIILISACDSSGSGLKSYMKCGIAANQLGMHRASLEIGKSLEVYVKNNKIASMSNAQLSYLGAEVRDDLNLEGLSFDSQIDKLIRVYNSSACQKMHAQGKVNLSNILTNTPGGF